MSKVGVAAHGLYRCTEYRLLSEPMSTRLLNSISSRICRQNTQFNMYTTTSKHQEGCTFKDSHPTCFITTNFDKFHREAFARGGEPGWKVRFLCAEDLLQAGKPAPVISQTVFPHFDMRHKLATSDFIQRRHVVREQYDLLPKFRLNCQQHLKLRHIFICMHRNY